MLPLAYTLGVQYGISSPMIIGLCFMPSGFGNVVGAPIAGRLADKAVIRGKQKRGGEWYPEDRLRATLSGALILGPLSVLVFGLTTQFISGRVGLIINLVCLFINGVGIDVVLSPSGTYTVDILRDRSAEVVAVGSALRFSACAITSALVLPAIETIGVAATNGITAGLGLLAFVLLWITIRYGAFLRSTVDIGYTLEESDN